MTSRALEFVQARTGVYGCVYIIDADHGVKVGVSRWPYPQERILDISRTAGIAMRLLQAWQFSSYEAACAVEKAAHAALRGDSTIGEWYHCHPLDAVEAVTRAVATRRMELLAA